MKHSPTPWSIGSECEIEDANGYNVGWLADPRDDEFMLTCVNAHTALVEALRYCQMQLLQLTHTTYDEYIGEALDKAEAALRLAGEL